MSGDPNHPQQRIVIRSDSPQPSQRYIQPLNSPNQSYVNVQSHQAHQTLYTTHLVQQQQPTRVVYHQQVQQVAVQQVPVQTVQVQSVQVQQVQVQQKPVPVPQVQQQLVYLEDTKLKEYCHELEKKNAELLIEIERLRNTPLPVKIEEKHTYIEDTSKIASLEQKLTVLITEIEKLQRVIQDKSHEAETLKMKLYDAENLANTRGAELEYWKSRYSEIEQWKIQLDSESQNWKQKYANLEQQSYLRNQQNESRIRELELIHSSFLGQIENLKSALMVKSEDHDSVLNKLNQTDQDLRQTSLQLSSHQERIIHTENEYQRLLQQLKQRNEEVDGLRNRYQQMENDYNKSISDQQSEYNRRIQDLRSYQNDLESKYQLSQTECDRLRGYVEENKRLSSSILDYQKSLNQSKILITQYESDIKQFTLQIDTYRHYTEENKRLQEYNITLQNSNSDYNRRIIELENRLTLAISECENLQNQKKKLLDENRYQSETIISFRNKQNEYESYRLELTNLQDQLKRLTDQLNYKSREYDDLNSRYINIQASISDYQKHQLGNKLLLAEIDRLKQENQEMNDQLAKWRIQWSSQSHLVEQNQQQLQLLVLCFAEIEAQRVALNSNRDSQYLQQQQQLRQSMLNNFDSKVVNITTQSFTHSGPPQNSSFRNIQQSQRISGNNTHN